MYQIRRDGRPSDDRVHFNFSSLFFFFFEKAGRDLKKFLNSLKCFIIVVVRRPLNGLELSFSTQS